MNVMCSAGGDLLALIDWGDAGWGDPALEFAQMPIMAVPHAVAGYESEAPGGLGDRAEGRIIWDQLGYAVDALPETRLLTEICTFLETADERWRVIQRSG
jgi:aminoglycoside phosphotransferase (APT) family kinase protein